MAGKSRPQQIPLSSGVGEQDIAGQEALINVYAESSEGSKRFPFTLKGTPGLALWVELDSLEVKALYVLGNLLYAFTATKLYTVDKSTVVTELGDIDIQGVASVESNGKQIVLVDGFKGFSYDTETEVLQEITDDAFYPARTVTFVDGYLIFDRKGTNQFFWTDPYSLIFDGLSFASAEASPDELMSIIANHRELLLFGEITTEAWYSSGGADLPWTRNNGAFIEKGIAAPRSASVVDNSVVWVGSDRMVYQSQGYTPVRISTHAVEKTLSAVDVSDAFAYEYHDKGHLFYMLTIPSLDLTWCWDASTRQWHIRRDYHFGRHRSNCHTFFAGRNLVGDFQNGRIYDMTEQEYQDDLTTIKRVITLPTVDSGRSFLTVYSLELIMAVGVGVANGTGSDPMAEVECSDDNGKTWTSAYKTPIGKMGEYEARIKWWRLGRFRQRVFRITISAPVLIDIGGAYIEVG